jgi:hypothetical protein
VTLTTPTNGSQEAIEKVAIGIPGFDIVLQGGLPVARSTLTAGTAGSGKTVFVTHFLAAGIQHFNEGAGPHHLRGCTSRHSQERAQLRLGHREMGK